MRGMPANACPMGKLISKFLILAAMPAMMAYPSLALGKGHTYCLGRYLVDVPAGAEWIGERNRYFFTKVVYLKGKSFYEDWIDMTLNYRKNDPDKIRYFYSKEDSFEGEQPLYISKGIEGLSNFCTIDTFAMTADGGYINFRGIEDDDQLHGGVEPFECKQLEDVASIYRNHILPSSAFRPNNSMPEIPAKPGFCVGYGFIADTDKTSNIPHEEMIELKFRLKKYPDVVITIMSTINSGIIKTPSRQAAHIKEHPLASLSERQKCFQEVKSFPKKAKPLEEKRNTVGCITPAKRIRSGQLTINGREGEESLLILQPDSGSGEVYFFMWESQHDATDLLNPYISVEVFAGQDKYHLVPLNNWRGDIGSFGAKRASPLAKKDVLRLFENIVKTIRIRPVMGVGDETP